MFKKFDKHGNLKVRTYWIASKLIANTVVYDCWLEDSDGYMFIHTRTIKAEEFSQFEELFKKYISEGWTEVVRVYSTKNNKQIYPQD